MSIVAERERKGFKVRVFWYKHTEGGRGPLRYGYNADGDGLEIEGLGFASSGEAFGGAYGAIDQCLKQSPPPRGKYRLAKEK
jgi:hypothetical protein